MTTSKDQSGASSLVLFIVTTVICLTFCVSAFYFVLPNRETWMVGLPQASSYASDIDGLFGLITFLVGFWFVVSFGSTVINVFGFPENKNSQPKNVLFGHLLAALIGITFITFFEVSFITLGLAVGVATMFMFALKVTHPPAGGTVIVAMIGDVSFHFLIFPVMVGTITIIIGGIIYNRLLLKKKYPITWK